MFKIGDCPVKHNGRRYEPGEEVPYEIGRVLKKKSLAYEEFTKKSNPKSKSKGGKI